MRVVSLLPSATELLAAIGGEHLLVGRSHECDWPPSLADRPVLTGQRTTAATGATTSAEIDRQVRAALRDRPENDRADQPDDTGADRSLYRLDADLLRELKPDVILTQDLCEVCSIDLNTVCRIGATMSPQPVIVSLNPKRLDDLFDDLLRVGEAVGMPDAAHETMLALRERMWLAREHANAYVEGPEIAFLEWMDPLFIGGHWTPQLIEYAGGRHSLNAPGSKSRQISAEELLALMPDRVVICPCGYDLKQTRSELNTLTEQRWWKLLPAVQDDQVVIVDGNQMFNRPGPRLIDALEWLSGWVNDRPELIPIGFPVRSVAQPSDLPAPP